MKNTDKTELNLLRVIKGEIGRLEDANTKLTDVEIISLLKKMVENIKQIPSDTSVIEIEIIERYLPKQLSENELSDIITTYMNKNDISSIKDMGKIMGFLKTNYGGQYDGNVANKIIKNLIVA